MLRLFITLYLMVIASFVLFIISVSIYQHLGESIGDGAIIDERLSKGSFLLLTDSIKGLDKQQREIVVKQHQEIFGNEFQLIELASKDFTQDQIEDLNNGKVVSISEKLMITAELNANDDNEETILYFKIPDSSLLWRTDLALSLNQTINENGLSILVYSGKFSEGVYNLIESRLKDKAEESWPVIIQTLQKTHDYPLSLKLLSSFNNLSDKQLSSIKKGNIVNISQGSHQTTFVHKVFDSSTILQLGPIEIPWHIRNVLYFSLFAFILSFATTLLLWIWPLWSNLMKIIKASDLFGNGDYDTRISYSSFSPIAKVSKAFNAMAEQTQRGIHTQKELTSAISHELRTPVARMRFALEMLDESTNKKDKNRFVKDINTDIDELDMLLEELLTYARLDHNNSGFNQGKLNPTNLSLWFKKTMQRLEPLAGTKMLSYNIHNISDDEKSLIESRLMSRVLDNLVQNAIRYAAQTIKVTLSKENGSFLLIVEDDGKGIPKNQREHVFDAFSRIDESRDRASGGFGLGLAIASRIVKNHKGTITLHEQDLGGACFIVRLPIINELEGK